MSQLRPDFDLRPFKRSDSSDESVLGASGAHAEQVAASKASSIIAVADDWADSDDDSVSTSAIEAALRGRGLAVDKEKSRKAQKKTREAKMRARVRCGCNAAADQYSINAASAAASHSTAAASSSEHRLFSNCTHCGRIHCEREGEGPCFFCNSFVTARGTIVNPELAPPLQPGQGADASTSADDRSVEAGLKMATAHKDKLLGYADSKAKRSSIVDDQEDFYDIFGSMDDAWLGNEEREARRSKAAEEHARLNQRRSEQLMQISFGFDLGAGHGPIATISSVDSEHDVRSSTSLSSVAAKAKAPSALSDSSVLSSETHSGSHFANHSLTGSAGQVYQALLAFRQQGRALTSSNSTTRQPAVHQQSSAPKRASQSTSHASGTFALPSSASAAAVPADCDDSPKSTSEASPAVQYDSSLLARVEKEWRRQDSFFVDIRLATEMLAKETALADTASSSLAGVAAATNSKSKSAAAIDVFPASGSDEGWTLTMHQPWASLLVCGIKRLEGRTWSSSHRGRLWIHSASHEPTAEEIESVEQMYHTLYKCDVAFPTKYPVSAVLGCVEVKDVLSQERLQLKLRGEHQAGNKVNAFNYAEDNDSPFLFICRLPMRVRLPIRCNGQHKLWQLTPQILSIAQRSLIVADQSWWLHAVGSILYPSAQFAIESTFESVSSGTNASQSPAASGFKPTLRPSKSSFGVAAPQAKSSANEISSSFWDYEEEK